MKTTVQEVEITVEAIQNTNRDIWDYHWMANTITMSDFSPSAAAMSGIESSLPTAPYTTSVPTYGAVQKKIRADERNERYIKQIKKLEHNVAKLENEKERIVIEGCMDNLSLKEIGQLLGVSKQAVFEIKEKAIRELAVNMYL